MYPCHHVHVLCAVRINDVMGIMRMGAGARSWSVCVPNAAYMYNAWSSCWLAMFKLD